MSKDCKPLVKDPLVKLSNSLVKTYNPWIKDYNQLVKNYNSLVKDSNPCEILSGNGAENARHPKIVSQLQQHQMEKLKSLWRLEKNRPVNRRNR